MTEEQIKLVNNLQEKIDNLTNDYNKLINRNKNYDLNKNDGNSISINLFNSRNIDLVNILSKEKHNSIMKLIEDTIKVELDLLIAERDSYILSKPV